MIHYTFQGHKVTLQNQNGYLYFQAPIPMLFGNNPKLVSFIKEILEKEPLIVPQAIQGKYMIPVRF